MWAGCFETFRIGLSISFAPQCRWEPDIKGRWHSCSGRKTVKTGFSRVYSFSFHPPDFWLIYHVPLWTSSEWLHRCSIKLHPRVLVYPHFHSEIWTTTWLFRSYIWALPRGVLRFFYWILPIQTKVTSSSYRARYPVYITPCFITSQYDASKNLGTSTPAAYTYLRPSDTPYDKSSL